MDHIIKIIQSNDKNLKLFNKIMEKDKQFWGKFYGINKHIIFKWLDNFQNEEEIYHALKLADFISYYNLNQIRYSWKRIIWNRVLNYLMEDIFIFDSIDKNYDYYRKYLAEHAIFVGYGKAGKSGPMMLSIFKQSHNIKGLVYMEFKEFLHTDQDLGEFEIIFLLDDFIGTGNQAIESWKKKFEKKSYQDISNENKHLKFIYLTLMSYKGGKETIERETPLKVISHINIDEAFQVFSDKSLCYHKSLEREKGKRIMEEKGKLLYKFPLGYKNMELAIAFHHNTPNNCLPVIWKKKEGVWEPLFERFE